MIYLYWYIGIGAVFLPVIFISHQLTKSPADDRLSELLQAADPRRDRWWWKPLNNVVVPILAAVMVLTVWPIAIYWKAKEMVDARRIKNEEPHKEFAVILNSFLRLHASTSVRECSWKAGRRAWNQSRLLRPPVSRRSHGHRSSRDGASLAEPFWFSIEVYAPQPRMVRQDGKHWPHAFRYRVTRRKANRTKHE